MTQEERDKFVAKEIKSGKCPFGMLKEGQTTGHCPLGFPGCGCGDEILLNPYLQEELKWQPGSKYASNYGDIYEVLEVSEEVLICKNVVGNLVEFSLIGIAKLGAGEKLTHLLNEANETYSLKRKD